MVNTLSRNLLVKLFRRQGWSISREKTDVWLRRKEYYLLFTAENWKLYVEVDGDLILVDERPYGRRQSQDIKRAVDQDKKERQRCSLK